MTLRTNKFAAATTVAAAFCLLATPAVAVDLPRPATAKVYDGDALDVQRDRRGRRHRDNDIDAGDVVAGVLVLGAIAAIAGAAKSSRNRDSERYEQRYPIPDDNAGYRTQGAAERADSRGLGNAVDICVGEIERGQGGVGSVDAASRSAQGWHVSGALESGAPFSCSIGNDGRVSDIAVGAYEAGYEAPAAGEWSDDDYARARQSQQNVVDGGYEVAKAQ